jgi:AcrR family transcriptional regulator
MAAKKQIAQELIAEGKRLYEQTLAPVDDIAAMMGVSRTLFYRIVREGKWRGRRASVATFEFARALTGSAVATIAPAPAEQLRADFVVSNDPVSPQQRAAVTQHLMNLVERELRAAERIIERIAPGDQIEAEHGARTLASISRTLREIKAFNQPDQVTPPDEADDDPVPRDIDEFRRELARRIRGFIEARRIGAGGLPAEPEGTLG